MARSPARADTVIGFPADAPEPPPAGAEARQYVMNLVTNPVAHRAMLAAMTHIEREILDVAPVDDDEEE